MAYFDPLTSSEQECDFCLEIKKIIYIKEGLKGENPLNVCRDCLAKILDETA